MLLCSIELSTSRQINIQIAKFFYLFNIYTFIQKLRLCHRTFRKKIKTFVYIIFSINEIFKHCNSKKTEQVHVTNTWLYEFEILKLCWTTNPPDQTCGVHTKWWQRLMSYIEIIIKYAGIQFGVRKLYPSRYWIVVAIFRLYWSWEDEELLYWDIAK